MAKLNKGRHVGSFRRKLLLNVVGNLGFEGDPNPYSNGALVAFILSKRPEIKVRRINARHDAVETLTWFERHAPALLSSSASKEVSAAKCSPRRRGTPSVISKDEFYRSWDWRTVRMKVLKALGAECQCCGARPGQRTVAGEPVRICVDHIKPLATHWHLRLDETNLQVLCDECNQGKGAWDQTDHRRDLPTEEADDGLADRLAMIADQLRPPA